jgi:hypothetical protein
MIMHIKNYMNTQINNFTIYAERHCGTKFLQSLIINHYNIPATYIFGWKHFFGFHNKEIMIGGKNTLFICITRDPFQWVHAMFKQPYHMKTENNITDFLLNPIYSYETENGNLCLEKEIIFERNIYTLDRYKNIFEMRNVKYNYLLYKLPKIAQNYIFIRYEDLCNNISQIQDIISSKLNIEPYTDIKNNFLKQEYKIKKEIYNIIKSNLDIKIENTMGYLL